MHLRGRHYKYFAVDQYGRILWIENYPRKELLKAYNRKHAEKMYIDYRGKSHHIGYIIAGNWLEVFKIDPNWNLDMRQK